MRILLVEDDPAQADTLAKLLLRADTEKTLSIVRAGTLREGIAKSNALLVDVTYLDLCLPDVKDWRETCAAIKRFYPPVIIVTAMDDAEGLIKLECFANGAQNFFVKPKDMNLIVPHLISSGAAAHLRREGPKLLRGSATNGVT